MIDLCTCEIPSSPVGTRLTLNYAEAVKMLFAELIDFMSNACALKFSLGSEVAKIKQSRLDVSVFLS